MHRSEVTVDLGALRRNVRTLLRVLEGAELWAVVKANGYGHGAADVAGAALGSGALYLLNGSLTSGFPRTLSMTPAARRHLSLLLATHASSYSPASGSSAAATNTGLSAAWC